MRRFRTGVLYAARAVFAASIGAALWRGDPESIVLLVLAAHVFWNPLISRRGV